jgi:hypothetical protein
VKPTEPTCGPPDARGWARGAWRRRRGSSGSGAVARVGRALGRGAWIALVLLAVSPVARAVSDKDKAGTLLERGLDKARSGDFAGAEPLFDQAFKLYPHPEILHNLARAHEEMGQLATALDEFRRALDMDKQYTFAADAQKRIVDLTARLRTTHGLVLVTSTPAQVELELHVDGRAFEHGLVAPAERWVPAGRLRVSGSRPGFVAGSEEVEVAAGSELKVELVLLPVAKKGFISVVTPVEGASVSIDGEAVGVSPLPSTTVEVGVHTVRVEAVGFAAFEERIVVEPDRETVVNATLVDLATAAPGAAPRVGLGSGLLGGGLAVAVVGGVLHGLAFRDAKQASEVDNDPLSTDDDARFDSLKKKAETKQAVAFASYGVGAALAGVGVYFLVRRPQSGQKTEARAPRLTPVVAPERGGLGLGAHLSF